MKSLQVRKIYVWEVPVRIFHWVNAISITVLIVTGLLITYPPALLRNREAWNTFLMGYIRVTHFIAAYFFVAAMLLRIYWAFAGNKYARLKVFFPFLYKKGLKGMWDVIVHDIFLFSRKENKAQLGHNSLAATMYLIMFFMALIMLFTGFGLYAQNASWWLPRMFSWVSPLLGGDMHTRLVHHTVMWFFVLFIVVHIYLAIFHDVKDADGEVSSMIGGYKFVEEPVGKEE